MTKKLIQLPFEGFYNSCIESIIDDYITELFDLEGTGDSSLIPEEFWYSFTYTDGIIKAIGEKYTSLFETWLDDEADIKINLEFESISSPKYYNFETDRLFAYISKKDIQKLLKLVNPARFEEVINARHSSRPGFISSYSNDPKDWQKSEFDHNELQTILIAAVLSQFDKSPGWNSETKNFEEHYLPCAWALWERPRDNGFFDAAIFNNMPQECQDIANKHYEKESAA